MSAPLRIPRLISYFLAFAFGIAGFGLGLHAVVRSHQEKKEIRDALRSLAGNAIHVDINTNDIFAAGAALTAACGLTAVLSLLSLLLLLLPARARSTGRSALLQGALFAFCTAFLLGALVPVTDFVASRSARVSGTLGAITLPQSLIDGAERLLGTTPVYHKIDYLLDIAIVPWFAFYFALTSAVLAFMARARTRRAAPAAVPLAEKANVEKAAV